MHREKIDETPEWVPFIEVKDGSCYAPHIMTTEEEKRNQTVDRDAMIALSESAALVGKSGEERLRQEHEEVVERRDRHIQ